LVSFSASACNLASVSLSSFSAFCSAASAWFLDASWASLAFSASAAALIWDFKRSSPS
jgi:hypothetical protein